MMKRIVMAVACALAVSYVAAQVMPQKVQGKPEHRNGELYRLQYSSRDQLHQESVELIPTIVDYRASETMTNQSKHNLVRSSHVAYQTPEADNKTKAFYWKPEGSFFMGVARQGENNLNGIVGSWIDDDFTPWIFQGRSENYTSLLYKTYLSHRLPDNYYTDPVTGDWHDSLIVTMRGAVTSTYSYDMPFLTVENGEQKDTFVLSSTHKNAGMVELDRNYMPPLTMAGGDVPYSGHEDNMWPMTNAMTVDCNNGYLVLGQPYNVQPLEYFIGTTDVTVKEGDATKTITPDGLVIAYEKPQSLLYVKDITMQLNAYELAKDGKAKNKAPYLAEGDTLWLVVENLMGAKIAESYATKNNIYPVVQKGDTIFSMLQFTFLCDTTVYGESISVGFNVNEPFNVKVTGLSKCSGDFSLVVANAIYGSNTHVLTTEGELLQYAEVEPYVMLNAIYPTFVDGYTDVKDTLVMQKMELGDGTFKNVAIYEEYVGFYTLVPALYSYSYPVDTLKQVSKWVFTGPDWVTWGYDDADWDGADYSDIITLYFFAEDLPEGVEFRDGIATVSFHGVSKSYYVYQGKKPADQGVVGELSDLKDNLVSQIRIASLENAFALNYPAEFTQVEIYTVAGTKVSTMELPANGSLMMDNSNLLNGMYIFRFMGESEAVVRALK